MKTILVIDDDEPILAIYGMTLENAGYRVLTTTSGAEGVHLARSNLPDLILCDINMPGMDGRNVLRSLRDDAEVGAKQIVLMAGNTGAITLREVMEMGRMTFSPSRSTAKRCSVASRPVCVEVRFTSASRTGYLWGFAADCGQRCPTNSSHR